MMVALSVAVECARCSLEFRGLRTLRMVWCPFDSCYYCGQCFREYCKPVHGMTPALRTLYELIGFAIIATFGPLFLPVAIVAVLVVPPSEVPIDNRPIGLALFAILGVGALALGLSLLSRRIRHNRRIHGHPPRSPNEFVEVPDPALDWHPNRPTPSRRGATLLAVVVAALGADVAIVLWMVVAASPSAVWSSLPLVALLSMIAGIAGFVALIPFSIPSAVAVAADGIHFWYESPYDRHTQIPVLSWQELNVLAKASPTLDPADRLVRSLRIDSRNAMDIVVGWQSHRIDGSRPRTSIQPAPKTPLRPPSPSPPTPQPVGLSEAISTGEGGRGTMCARCHVRFPGFQRLRLLWCTVDRFYVCRRCWEDGCAEGHGKGILAISKPAPIVAAALIISLGLAVWYPGVVYDHTVLSAWRDAEPSRVADLIPGELAKVAGTMESRTSVAFGGHEWYSSKSGWWWDFNTTDSFTLVDSSGAISVTTKILYVVYNGPHYASYAYHTQGTVYLPGDSAVILGTVATSSNGTKQLEAQVLASQQTSLGPGELIEDATFGIPWAIGVVWIAVGSLFIARWKRHGQAVEGVPSVPVGAVDITRDPALEWKPNRKRARPRRPGSALAAGIGAAALLLALFPGYFPRAWFGYWDLGLIGTLAVMFESALFAVLLLRIPPRPSEVAVDDKGFRMWYESPYDRLLNDSIFPWDQVRDIHLTGGKAPRWVLVWTTGEVDDLSMLSGENRSLLIDEWTRRAMPSAD